MKATLEFNLPEEQENFDIACKAANMHRFIYELNHNFLKQYKNQDTIDKDDLIQELLELSREFDVDRI
jgi:hypothetical protein